jgi:hypothetical protein
MRGTLLLSAVVVVLAGCGGGGSSKPKGLPGTPDPAVKQAAQAYLDAYAAKDPAAICARLTPLVRKQLADNKGTCVKTIRFSLRKAKTFPKLTIGEARADGDTGRALVKGQSRQVSLKRVGGSWLVSDGGT